jgi:REP element-mobilizing transposase RayT
MTGSNKLPSKCRECAKSKVSNIHQKCHFCSELEFKELVLCDLNQCIQDEADFRCHAFQPILKLVSTSENGTTEQHDAAPKRHKRKSYMRLFDSDKMKYERALALQKLGRDPEGVYVQLKYHLAWNVTHRTPVFNPTSHFIDLVHDTFLKCSELAGGFVALLYLAPDHVHLYVESDGELSVEEVVYRIKRFSNNAILDEFPSVRDKLGGNTEIWDEAYFMETVS